MERSFEARADVIRGTDRPVPERSQRGTGSTVATVTTRASFQPTVGSVPRARHLVVECLARWNAEAIEDAAAIVVSELVTNVVKHARTHGTLVLSKKGGRVRLEVSDHAPDRPVVARVHALDDPGGRGLPLVAAFAETWGVEVAEATKTVWAEWSCPMDAQASASREVEDSPTAPGTAPSTR